MGWGARIYTVICNFCLADARCTQRYCWCTQHLMRKVKNIPFEFFKKICAPVFSYSAIFLLPLLLPRFPANCLFLFRELCLGLPRVASSSFASLPPSSMRWLFFFRELPLRPSYECLFFFRSSASFRSSVLHQGKPNVPFLVSLCFHFCLRSAICGYVVGLLKDLGHPQ